MIVNSSLINVQTDRTDLTEILIPATQISLSHGSNRSSNIAVLACFVGATKLVKYETMQKVLKEKLGSRKELLEGNLKVLEEGYNLGATHQLQVSLV